MAKVTSLFQIQGALGDTIFATRNGKKIAYMRGAFDKEKWLTNRKGTNSRENAQEFGGAAMAGSAIYKALRNSSTRDIFLPYAHNHIAKRLRKHAPHTPGQRAANEYTLQAAIPALHGLNLSQQGSASDKIRLTPIGPCHRPEAVRVKGLREAADAIGNPDGTRLEFRITRKTIAFPEIHFDKEARQWNRLSTQPLQIHDHTTPWIPIECLPKEGLTLALSVAHPNCHPEPCHPEQSEGSSTPCTTAEQSAGATSSPRELPIQDPPRTRGSNSNSNSELSELSGPSEQSELSFLIIEWRQIRGKKKPKLLPNHGLIRLAAIRTTPTHAQEMANQGIQTPKRTRRYKKQPPKTPIQRYKHKNPTQFLKSALKGISYYAPT